MTPDSTIPRVRLRDATLADADLLDAMSDREKTGGGYNDFGLTPQPVDREALAKGPLRNDRNGMLLVERIEDGAVIGTVGWHLVRYGPNPESDTWNVGIELIPGARGRGYGTEAQRLLAEYLFETTGASDRGVHDVANVAEQRSSRGPASPRIARRSSMPGPTTTWSYSRLAATPTWEEEAQWPKVDR
jgi:RimJ/RimL family protein N-acetyltransferase